ncbi:hypothetical protein [Nocardioides houyundeii]|uniref:hypothetical protein n=1 Tax=Nocardioides houyundeii TaxID=2045452 RepID=UPI000C77F98E|nr:hypothetical protein [Nocardioides houyundeii]
MLNKSSVAPLGALVAAALFLAGCGESAEENPPSGSGAGGTVSEAPAVDPEASPSPAESATEPPAAALAQGEWAEVSVARIRGPKGWSGESNDPGDGAVALKAPYDAVSGLTMVELADSTEPTDIDTLGRQSLDDGEPEVTLRKPVELDGVEVFRTAGPVDDYFWIERYGVVHNGQFFRLTFTLTLRTPAVERQQIIDSVLPTFEWK